MLLTTKKATYVVWSQDSICVLVSICRSCITTGTNIQSFCLKGDIWNFMNNFHSKPEQKVQMKKKKRWWKKSEKFHYRTEEVLNYLEKLELFVSCYSAWYSFIVQLDLLHHENLFCQGEKFSILLWHKADPWIQERAAVWNLDSPSPCPQSNAFLHWIRVLLCMAWLYRTPVL